MALYRVKARWTGFTGSPGYSIFHFDIPVDPNETDAAEHAEEVRLFFSALTTRLPAAVKIQVESAVEIIETTTGQLTDVVTIPSVNAVQGQASGAFASSTGACVVWTTAGVRNGRRVMGRTFVVPLSVNAYDVDGTLGGPALQDLQDAAALLVGDSFGFQVYGRPSSVGAADGDSYTVTGARVADKAAVLRSRRD